jgi:hypothetical protein
MKWKLKTLISSKYKQEKEAFSWVDASPPFIQKMDMSLF